LLTPTCACYISKPLADPLKLKSPLQLSKHPQSSKLHEAQKPLEEAQKPLKLV